MEVCDAVLRQKPQQIQPENVEILGRLRKEGTAGMRFAG